MVYKALANMLKLHVSPSQKCRSTSASPSQKVMAKQHKLSVETLLTWCNKSCKYYTVLLIQSVCGNVEIQLYMCIN